MYKLHDVEQDRCNNWKDCDHNHSIHIVQTVYGARQPQVVEERAKIYQIEYEGELIEHRR